MDKSPTRMDKASPSLEIMTTVACIMREKHYTDWMIMYTLRAWLHLDNVGAIKKEHLLAVLDITDSMFAQCTNRLRAQGYLALDKQTGYYSIPLEGKRKMYRLQGQRSLIWKKLKEYAHKINYKDKVKNLTNGKTKSDDNVSE